MPLDCLQKKITTLLFQSSTHSFSIVMVSPVVNPLTTGVIWNGNTLLPNVKQTLSYLRSQKKQLIFVSNNSTKSRREYTKKFAKLGIPISEDEIFGSSYSAAIYLSRVLKFPKDKKVYVLGERGVEEELEAEGIAYVGGTSPEDRGEFGEADYEAIKPDQSIGAVLCGLDQHISYKKLAKGLMYLRQSPEVLFLATNTDSTYPTHDKLFPGAGTTTTTPLQFASKRQATTCGKPSQTMMDAIFARYDLDRDRTCMVGDRLDTDIKFGLQGKLGGTLLVLSGVNSLEDCEKESIFPKYVTNGFGDLSVLEK
jgi:4-nitrophenyl phosphatase